MACVAELWLWFTTVAEIFATVACVAGFPFLVSGLAEEASTALFPFWVTPLSILLSGSSRPPTLGNFFGQREVECPATRHLRHALGAPDHVARILEDEH